MRVVLIGTVESTVVTLEQWIDHSVPPVALLTLPPDESGRHSNYQHLAPLARQNGVRVLEEADVNAPGTVRQLQELEPDYLLVIGWSRLLREEALRVPARGTIGFHPSLLPENRGRAVIAWTILQRRRESGASLFWIDPGVDSGDVLAQRGFPVAEDETAATLSAKARRALVEMWDETIPSLRQGNAPRTPQDHSRASYCAKRRPEDGEIDWSRPAEEIWTLVRATGRPYPGAFTFHRGQRMTVWSCDYDGPGPYWGLPGQIQRKGEDGLLVQCGDREHVLLNEIEIEGKEAGPPTKSAFRLHEKLGAA